MREILFRGKRTDNGEWVYGSLSLEYLQECGCVMISPTADTCYKVSLETVGQFTGLTDQTGKKIFEGDIVQAHFRTNHSKQKFRVIFEEGMFLFDNKCVEVPKYDIYGMRVIGNIYDNPELLEAEQ